MILTQKLASAVRWASWLENTAQELLNAASKNKRRSVDQAAVEALSEAQVGQLFNAVMQAGHLLP